MRLKRLPAAFAALFHAALLAASAGELPQGDDDNAGAGSNDSWAGAEQQHGAAAEGQRRQLQSVEELHVDMHLPDLDYSKLPEHPEEALKYRRKMAGTIVEVCGLESLDSVMSLHRRNGAVSFLPAAPCDWSSRHWNPSGGGTVVSAIVRVPESMAGVFEKALDTPEFDHRLEVIFDRSVARTGVLQVADLDIVPLAPGDRDCETVPLSDQGEAGPGLTLATQHRAGDGAISQAHAGRNAGWNVSGTVTTTLNLKPRVQIEDSGNHHVFHIWLPKLHRLNIFSHSTTLSVKWVPLIVLISVLCSLLCFQILNIRRARRDQEVLEYIMQARRGGVEDTDDRTLERRLAHDAASGAHPFGLVRMMYWGGRRVPPGYTGP